MRMRMRSSVFPFHGGVHQAKVLTSDTDALNPKEMTQLSPQILSSRGGRISDQNINGDYSKKKICGQGSKTPESAELVYLRSFRASSNKGPLKTLNQRMTTCGSSQRYAW
ncbi:hypothetical protein STEG23_000422, partial [Scotinomys teguina]